MDYKFVLFKSDSSGEWFCSIRANNGQPIFITEGYNRKNSAVEALYNFLTSVLECGDIGKLLSRIEDNSTDT